MANSGENGQLRRRRVFYLPGFDPAVPRRYRELYRREGMRQAAISDYELVIEPPHAGQKGYGWGVWLRDGSVESRAHVSVLGWHDIVRRAMGHGPLCIHALLWRTHWIFLSTGAMAALWRLRPGPMLASVYVTLVMLAQLALAFGLAGLFWWGAVVLLAPAPVAGLATHGAGALAAAAAGYALLAWFRRRDTWLMAHYMLQDFAHSVAHRGAWAGDMESRIDAFAAEIGAALRSDWDEVLVVAHSSGCAVAVSALARALRAAGPAPVAPVALMTLGQLIPLQGFMPRAQGFRRDLRDLACDERLFWLDVTAKGDGACFWLTDPVAVCGVQPTRQHNPLVISAAFSRALKPETWKRLRRRFYRLHFQYLSAFDNPQGYDYFRITAGAMTLRERFADRANSPQCERRVFAPARARGMA